jgi:hypothetical protein
MMLPPSCAIIPFFVTDTAGIVKEHGKKGWTRRRVIKMLPQVGQRTVQRLFSCI